jgi:hypothetical protein
MKTMLKLMAAILVCLLLACPVLAAQSTFVPSISYKDGPDVEDAKLNDEDVETCLVITSIKQAQEQTTDIYQHERDLLLDIYQQLTKNDMQLPLDDDYVVRELLDVSFRKEDCVEADHKKEELLSQPNVTLTVTFRMNIDTDTDLVVLVWVEDHWEKVEKVTINKDNTVTCEFETIGPVAFCVNTQDEKPPQTGDALGARLLLWVLLMAVSLVAVIALLVNRRKLTR